MFHAEAIKKCLNYFDLIIQQAMDSVMNNNQIISVAVMGTFVREMEIFANEFVPTSIDPFLLKSSFREDCSIISQ